MKNWRLLVVDDDRIAVALIGHALRELGTIETAASGPHAIERLKTAPLPDLILLDALMPGLNGFEVCAYLKATPALAAIPVIFVTGQSDQGAEARALGAGAVDFISKPLSLPVVQARVRTQLTLIEQQRSLQRINQALLERIATQSSEIESLLRIIPDPIWFKNVEGVYLAANSAALRSFGHIEAEVIGHTDHELFPPDLAAKAIAEDQEVLASGGQRSFERETHSPKTQRRILWEISKIPVSAHLTPEIADDAEKPIGVLAIARDVTSRKQIEEQLRMLSLAVEQNPNSVIITDRASRIEYVNKAFSRRTGYPAEAAIGQRAGFLRSGKTPMTTFSQMWRELSAGRPWKGRFYNCTRDGEEIIEFAHLSPIFDASGNILHFLSIQEDITERVRLAQEVSHSRAAIEIAEAASQAKSAFLANMSHEIRTPMNAIIGLTHLMRYDRPTPSQQERLGKMEVAAKHLLGIINDILDISKIEAGRLELAPADFRLADIIDSLGMLVAERVKAKGLVFSSSIADLPAMLHGDAMRLTQILLNYIGNAVKFTAAGSVRLIGSLLEETSDSVFIRFTVEDTGIGIAPAHLPHLFQAFAQADNSTTRQFGGTGLGLRINRHLAQLMGGDTGVDSTLGLGSAFWVTVRLGKIKAGNLPDKLLAGASLDESMTRLRGLRSGACVLLAEDNAINQEVALSMLRDVGIAADLASDGTEAIMAASAKTYDLILMDMQMPELDGLAATTAIRRLPNYGATPIIAMTANAFSEDREACLDAGMNAHIGKPVDPQTFYSTLLEWLPEMPAAALPPTAEPSPPLAAAPGASFADLPELDYERGLKQMSGNVATYQRLLRQFADGCERDIVTLRNLLAVPDHDKARRLAHNLKGSSGTLGAMDLHEVASALENALRQAADAEVILARFEALATRASQLVRAIATVPA